MSALEDHEVVQFVLVRLTKRFDPPIPVEAVAQAVNSFRVLDMYPELADDDWSTVEKIVKSKVKITMDPGTTLTDGSHTDWLAGKHEDIDWKRWLAYRQLLTTKGFSPGVISNMEEATSEILNCIGDPTEPGNWRRRGLVIGDVQSGKTATYLGVVNRAADAGYKLIVLLAGGTEALRKQTQFRVDEGLLGRNTALNDKLFGVGKFQNNFLGATSLTTQATDFRKTSKEAVSIALDPNSPTPLVFVLKKNKTALENVRDWIKAQRVGADTVEVPMLLVDDESDYATVNTKDDSSPTVINALIREILRLASKSSYMAFTATPFANVFIDHETADEALGDDLFPKDYIRTLEAPSNYVGSTAYFGSDDRNDDSKLVSLSDVEALIPFKHKSHHVVEELPDTLVEAIRAFVIASAIRESRGDSSPRSMLINVSRFKNVQAQVHELVEDQFTLIKWAVELHANSSVSGSGLEHEEIKRLRAVFERLYGEGDESWEVVRRKLIAAVHGVGVRLVNSDRVKHAHDLGEIETDRMIAVGGDVLSRGLTLEGLTISYFHRLVGASDTLLQMARWFGYRPDYEDLCRVWIPKEVAHQFRYVAGIVDELRTQLKVMKKQKLTPRDFGLSVRMHPETLMITARNKMKAAEAKAWTINVAGARNLETVRISSDPGVIAKNHAAVLRLINQVDLKHPGAAWDEGRGSIRAISGVDQSLVADFLDEYIGYVSDPHFADSAIPAFVRSSKNPLHQQWIVGFVPGRKRETRSICALPARVPGEAWDHVRNS